MKYYDDNGFEAPKPGLSDGAIALLVGFAVGFATCCIAFVLIWGF